MKEYECLYTLNHYEETLQKAKDLGYKFVSCNEYFINHKIYEKENQKIFINRVDVDISCKKAKRVSDIFEKLNIHGTFFIRLHSDEYNPFSFENYLIIKEIIKRNEIGLHSEIIDCSKIWSEEDIKEVLFRDLSVFEEMFNFQANGVASHGGLTGYNNLDFWKENKAKDCDLYYEAYDEIFFKNFYISLLLLTGWKCYDNGQLQVGNNKCLCKHLDDNHRVIYCNIHPIKLYERHIYE